MYNIKRYSLLISFISLQILVTPKSIYAQDYEQRIKDLDIELYQPKKPVANYVKAVTVGNLVFLAGHGPQQTDGTSVKGKLGKNLTIEQGQKAARLAAISLLSSLKAETGTLNRVKRIVKVTGMVNSTSDFEEHPKIINGCSDLLVAIFGEAGKHARAAVGMGSLPFGMAVEIEMIVEVSEE